MAPSMCSSATRKRSSAAQAVATDVRIVIALRAPDEVAAEIVENLEAALERFRKVAAELATAGD